MRQDHDQNEVTEQKPRFSQGDLPGCEDEKLEDEIGELFDELTQEGETTRKKDQGG